MNIKKMTAFASVAICAAVAFGDGIESSNIAGVQAVTIPTGYSMWTVTFKGFGNTSYDFIKTRLLNASGVEFDDSTTDLRSRGKVSFQKVDLSTGNLISTAYDYQSRNAAGSRWRQDGTVIPAGTLMIAAGEGIYLSNTQGAEVKLEFYGEVELTPVTTLIASGYSIIGNFTPVTVDITKIKILNSSGVEYDDSTTALRSRGKVSFQLLDSVTGNLLSDAYDYQSRNAEGSRWRKNGTVISAETEFLAPGQAVYLNNGQGEGILLQFPNTLN